MKNVFFVYTQEPRGVYMIWGHYIIENGTSNLVPTFSNVLGPHDHSKTQIWESYFFAYQKWPKKATFCTQKMHFLNLSR